MLSFLRSNTLSPAWSFTASGIIWRMVLAGSDRIVGESRDPEQKTASYFCIDLTSGLPLWKDVMLEEPWWVGIEAVQHDVLLLHGFAQPDMPQHKGIRAYDSSTGTELWRNGDATYWFGRGDVVIAYRDYFEKRVGYEIDLRSGAIMKTHDTSLDALHELRRLDEPPLPLDVTMPEVLKEEEAPPQLAKIIRKETKGRTLVGNVEYVSQRDFLLFNFHVPQRDSGSTPTLENHFVVYRVSDARRIYAEIIARGLTGYVPDSFFLQGSHALFIKDQKTLTALRLWTS